MAEEPSSSEYEFLPREEPQPAPAAPEAPAGPEQPVEARICPNCGAQVFGKTPKNRCPECAGELGAAAELLQFSSPAWSRTLAAGALLLIPAILLHSGAMTQAWLDDSPTAGALFHVAGAILALVGTWMLTLRESRPHVPSFRWALLARAIAVLSLLIACALLIPIAAHPAFATGMIVALLVAFAIHALSIGLHLRDLAVRVPSDSLFWWSQNLAWLVPVCALGQIPLHVVGRAKAEFLMLFMCAIPLAAGFVAIALAACLTLVKAAAELRNAAVANEGITARRLKKEQELAAAKANRRP